MPERGSAHLLTGEENLNTSRSGVTFEYPNVAKVDLLLTLRCNAACAHCITRSNPRRTEHLTEDEVVAVLDAAAAAGKRATSLTGGEPFLDFPMLLRLVAHARSLGLFVAADTNAYWGVTQERADEWVGRLLEAGLGGLFPSATPYHLPFVALDRVARVVDACDRLGLPCEVNFVPGPDTDVNETILARLDLRERGFFNDGLSLTGNDVSGLVDLFPALRPADIDDIGSMHLGVGARGEAIANVDISDEPSEFDGTPLLLGNVRADGCEAVLRAERERPVLAVTRTQAPRDVDAFLRADPALASTYAGDVGGRRFLSATEYFLALFHSPQRDRYVDALAAWGEDLLPGDLAGLAGGGTEA